MSYFFIFLFLEFAEIFNGFDHFTRIQLTRNKCERFTVYFRLYFFPIKKTEIVLVLVSFTLCGLFYLSHPSQGGVNRCVYFTDGKLRLFRSVRLVRLQTDNCGLFLRQQTDKRQTSVYTMRKRIKENRLLQE